MENEFTIAESYEIPSKGLVYDKVVDGNIKIRSMTTQEEMKRLSSSDTPYKIMSDVIEACLVEKPGVRVYDMCLGDYEYLMHRLRVVTYGSDYKMSVSCPSCRKIFETRCNLDGLAKKEYTEEVEALKHITLPVSGKLVDLKFQTPRILDSISTKRKDILTRNPSMLTDPSYLLNLESVIDKVDGQVLGELQKDDFVRKLSMKDANYLYKKAVKLNESVGLKSNFTCKCPSCGFETDTTFRITSEFFDPSIDDE